MISNRIKELRLALKLTQQAFAAKLGISRSHVASLEAGACEVIPRVRDQIILKYQANRDWLDSGEGPMFVPVQKNLFGADMVEETPKPYNAPDVAIMVHSDIVELVTATIEVLQSDHPAKSALSSNILTFRDAVRTAKTTDKLMRANKELTRANAELQRRMDALEKALHPHVPSGNEAKEE